MEEAFLQSWAELRLCFYLLVKYFIWPLPLRFTEALMGRRCFPAACACVRGVGGQRLTPGAGWGGGGGPQTGVVPQARIETQVGMWDEVPGAVLQAEPEEVHLWDRSQSVFPP